jgi:hypothetical protein
MGELLNEVTTNKSITEYDRSYAGAYDNPYEGRPSLTFHMHRVTVMNDTDTVIAAQSLPNVKEPYTPGKTYQMMNPQSGVVIPGATFTAETAYAIIYSMMIRAIADNKAVTDAIAALAAAQATHAAALKNYNDAVAAGEEPRVIDDCIAAVSAAASAVAAATSTLQAAQAAVA